MQNVSKLTAVQGVEILTPSKLWSLSTLDEVYTDIMSGMNNIQNLHVVIPHINGEAVNHSATKRQP
ncbi:hypothetical protein, partial [Lactococcus lactis]|uniref:hypothetical protein n=1 Tax=Lactococcus lactis TaxID=1358 RepID=UPI00223BCB8A